MKSKKIEINYEEALLIKDLILFFNNKSLSLSSILHRMINPAYKEYLSKSNKISIKLLDKLGFTFIGMEKAGFWE